MGQQLYLVFKTARPRQWIKNLAIYASLLFSGFLFDPSYFFPVTATFLLFNALSSAVYIINDIHDAPIDKKHPFKKKRPLASGQLHLSVAWATALLLLATAFIGASLFSLFLFLIFLGYFLLNIWYTTRLKNVPILDVMIIAAGFILRVYAGAVVVDLHMSVWFLLTIISVSLFMAIGKRQSERTLLKGQGDLSGHRITLSSYSERLLDMYTSMFAAATWLTYALFAFQQQFTPHEGEIPIFFFSRVPRAFVAQKWLMITVPIVIFGVMRYLHLVNEENRGESPERVLLNDAPLLSAVVLWLIAVITIVYVL